MNVAPDHPAFSGHFPGSPVLPGVVLLTEVLAEIAARTNQSPQDWTIVVAKFLSGVRPNESLTVALADTPSGGFRFEARSAGEIVASGTLAPRRAA